MEEGEEEKIEEEEEEEEEKERVGEEGIEDDIFSYGGLLVVLRSGMNRGDCLGKSRRKNIYIRSTYSITTKQSQ